MPGLNQMSSTSSAGASVITLQFTLSLDIDVAEQQVQAAISGAQNLRAAGSARASDLREGQSRRRAGSDPRHHLECHAAHAGGGSGRYPHGAEDLADQGRRRRERYRWPAPRGAGHRQPAGARRLRTQHRRSAHDHQRRESKRPQGHARWPVAGLHDQHQRSAQERRRVFEDRRRLPQQLAGAAPGRRHPRGERREHEARRLDEQDSRADRQCAAPAGGERGRRSQPDPGHAP